MVYAIQDYVKQMRKARLERGWSQKELAQKAGITQSHLSRIEGGEMDMRFSNVIELVRLLNLEVLFVPKHSVTSINSLIDEISEKTEVTSKPAFTLDEEEDR